MGGKGGGDGGNQAVEEQKKQAAEARKKEEERKARIKEGMGSIKNAFEGAPVMETQQQAFDWSKFVPPAVARGGAPLAPASGIPEGWTAVQVADPRYQASQAGAAGGIRSIQRGGSTDIGNGRIQSRPADLSRDGLRPWAGNPAMKGDPQVRTGSDNYRITGGNPNGGKIWALKDAQGNLHYQGQGFNYDAQVDTGRTSGGFDDGFYDKYKQGILDYYTPQVADQYGDAKDELTYRLARAGTLRSSVAADEVADLSKQNDLNRAQVLNKADQGAADLRSNVAAQRAKVESQLLASEDPNAAASQALAAVKNISLDQPEMSPLGMIFNVGTIGAANALRGYQAKTAFNAFNGASPSGAQRVIR